MRFDSVLQSLPDLTKWLGEMQEYFKMKSEIQNFLLNNDGRTEELTAKVASESNLAISEGKATVVDIY